MGTPWRMARMRITGRSNPRPLKVTSCGSVRSKKATKSRI